MMKRSLLLVFAVVLLASPAVYACEECFEKGTLDPAGNYLANSDRCWSGYEKGYAYCYIPTGSTKCEKGVDSTCTGSSTGRIQHKDPVGMTAANPFDCTTDLSGKCSGDSPLTASFLE